MKFSTSAVEVRLRIGFVTIPLDGLTRLEGSPTVERCFAARVGFCFVGVRGTSVRFVGRLDVVCFIGGRLLFAVAEGVRFLPTVVFLLLTIFRLVGFSDVGVVVPFFVGRFLLNS